MHVRKQQPGRQHRRPRRPRRQRQHRQRLHRLWHPRPRLRYRLNLLPFPRPLLPRQLRQLPLWFLSVSLLLRLWCLRLFNRLVWASPGRGRPTLFPGFRLPLWRLLLQQSQLLRYQSPLL